MHHEFMTAQPISQIDKVDYGELPSNSPETQFLHTPFPPIRDISEEPDSSTLAYHILGGLGLEKLCYDLLRVEGKLPKFFGRPGQSQYGIDLLIEDGGLVVYQCKNLAKPPTKAEFRAAIDKFNREWPADFHKPKAFIYVCPWNLNDKDVVSYSLKQPYPISFWDRTYLDSVLRGLPDLVAHHFSEEVAYLFCKVDFHNDLFIPIRHLRDLENYHQAGPFLNSEQEIPQEPPDRVYIEKLYEKHVVWVHGPPGLLKTWRFTEMALQFQSNRRCYYLDLIKFTVNIDTLLNGFKARKNLPSIFVLDNCEKKVKPVSELLDRLRTIMGKTDYKVVCLTTAPDPLAADLEHLQRQRSLLEVENKDLSDINQQINKLKRLLREGRSPQKGDTLCGRYELHMQLGSGGFASVWRAMDLKLNRLVALKVLHGQYRKDRTRRERFFRGAQKMQEMKHEGVVTVHEPKCRDGHLYFYVMEYLPGGDLEAAVLKGAFPREHWLQMLLQVGDALQFAHKHKLVHRDIKPSNILLNYDSSRAFLSDFDLVRDATSPEGTMEPLGTFIFAAPECMHDGAVADERADVFGLGMTCVFAMAGKKLDTTAMASGFIDELGLPSALARALARAVALKRDNRTESVAAFCLEIRSALSVTSKECVSPAYILHLSELNLPRSVNNALRAFKKLSNDLRMQNVNQLDALIVSGDATQNASIKEYSVAEYFLELLMDEFMLLPQNLIVVPGNHDVDWVKSRGVYPRYKTSAIQNFNPTRQMRYAERFLNFSNFYYNLKGEKYSLVNEDQTSVTDVRSRGFCVLGLNSAWESDHYFKDRASINHKALHKGLEKMPQGDFLKIAVFHHPLEGSERSRIIDDELLEYLGTSGFRIVLHGNIRRVEVHEYKLDQCSNGRGFTMIGGGPFGPYYHDSDWEPGFKCHYNLLRVEKNNVVITTRQQTRPFGDWEPCPIWRMGVGRDPSSSFSIDFRS